MKNKILRIIQASMLVVGVVALGGCFERQYYGGPGYGYAPGYAYGPAYYPRSYSYAPEYRPAYRYDGGGRGWAAHERHEEHEEHEEHEHHGRDRH